MTQIFFNCPSPNTAQNELKSNDHGAIENSKAVPQNIKHRISV